MVNHIARGFLKWAVVPYFAAYLLSSAHIAHDYNRNYHTRVEQNPVETLRIHRYRTEINGKEKHFTLVGEHHNYTIRENEIAKRLVDSHDYYASESGDSGCSGVSLFTKLEIRAVDLTWVPLRFFYEIGTGRRFNNIRQIATNEGHKVYSLEGCPNENIPFGFQASRVVNGIKGALVGPLIYYAANEENKYIDEIICDDSLLVEVRPKRDSLQAEGLVRLLETKDIDNLLATVGLCHLDGVTRHLSEQLELEEIK